MSDTPTESSSHSDERSLVPVEREEFLKHRQRLEDLIHEGQRTADKMVVSGAGGALILSITFIDIIAPTPDPASLWLLSGAWLLMGMSLLVVFLSHYASQKALRTEISRMDAEYSKMPLERHANHWDRITAYANYAAAILLLIGLAFLGGFAYSNTRFDARDVSQISAEALDARLSLIESRTDSLLIAARIENDSTASTT